MRRTENPPSAGLVSFARSTAAIAIVAATTAMAAMSPAEAEVLLAGSGGVPHGGVVVTSLDALPLAERWLQSGGAPVRYIPLSDTQFTRDALYDCPPAGTCLTSPGWGYIGKTPITFGNTSPDKSISEFLGDPDPSGSDPLVSPVEGFSAAQRVGNTFFQFQGVVTLAFLEAYIDIAHDDGFDLRLFALDSGCGVQCWRDKLEPEPTRSEIFNTDTRIDPDKDGFAFKSSNDAPFGPFQCAVDGKDPVCFEPLRGINTTDAVSEYFFVLSYYSNNDVVSRLDTQVPEPATLGLLGVGAIGLALASRQRKRQPSAG